MRSLTPISGFLDFRQDEQELGGRIVVELKAVQAIATAHEVQTVHYLTATGIDVGLLINFGGREPQACNLGSLRLSVHNGTHADAPFHYNDRGTTIDALPPDLFVGPARVIDARDQASFSQQLFAGLTPHDVAAAPRILFRTDTWLDHATFPSAWPLLDRTLPAWLAAQGVKLIGLDVPSVDPLTNTDMAIHHLLDAANIVILESLDLRNVAAIGCHSKQL